MFLASSEMFHIAVANRAPMSHPASSHGWLVIMGFVIATRLRYQHPHTGVTQEIQIRKAAGVHPPTNVPGAYGVPGLPGAPLSLVAASAQ
jgi:hypothetical protein